MLEEAAEHIKEAIKVGRTDILKKLIEQVKSTIEEQNDIGITFEEFINNPSSCPSGTFLHEAVKHGKQDAVRTLLLEGSDPAVLNAERQTIGNLVESPEIHQVFTDVLLQAIAASEKEKIKQLLASGIKINLWDTEKTRNSPLHWAATFSDTETVQLLLNNHANVNALNVDGATPLHDAIQRGDKAVAEALLKAGADPGIKATAGTKSTLLHWAAAYGDLSTVQLLIENGANVNALNGEGVTPLHYANMRQAADIVEALTKAGGKFKDKSSVDLAQDKDELNAAITEALTNGHLPNENLPNGDSRGQNVEEVPTTPKRSNSTILPTSDLRSSPVTPLITDERLNLIWPRPMRIEQLLGDESIFGERLQLVVCPGKESVHRILDVWDTHRTHLNALGRRVFLSDSSPVSEVVGTHGVIHCHVNDRTFNVEGAYRLTISHGRMVIVARDLVGLHHAIVTVIQMLGLFREDGITPVHITDQPSTAMRGVLMDLNKYGRVPRTELMLPIIDNLSNMKINQLHLFIRITKKREWQLPYPKSEFLSFDRFCRDRFIRLVPAIDVDHECLAEEVQEYREVLRDILRCFDSLEFIHLGPRMSSQMFSKDSKLRMILPSSLDHVTFFVCGNSLAGCDAAQLPINTVILQYGFQKSSRFTEALIPYRNAGLSIGICSGSGAWSSLTGSPEAMVMNVLSANYSAHKLHATALINVNWASDPALNHFVFSWPGFLLSAGLAWNPLAQQSDYIDSVLPDILDYHVLGDLANESGRALLELGRAESLLLREVAVRDVIQHNSILMRIITNPDDVDLLDVTAEGFGVVMQHIRRAQGRLLKAKPANDESESWIQEIQLGAELLHLAARIGRALCTMGSKPGEDVGLDVVNFGLANLPPTFKTDIANKLLSLVEQYRALWLSRYESPGLHGSLLVLSNLLRTFIPEDSDMIIPMHSTI